MNAATAEITLTADQQQALDAFFQFVVNPLEKVFVLSGYSGCGKSTLVRTLLDRLPGFMKAARLINPQQDEFDIELTATTNKAAENLYQITGHPVKTIHAALGLRVQTDYKTGVTTLIPRSNVPSIEDSLLFVDEASYVDAQLLGHIFKLTARSKIVFIGDPAQLTPVKSTGTPVFDANFPGAALTQVVRQAEGNPIVELSTKFRHTVNTGEFFRFKPDGHHIRHLDRHAFNAMVEQEFTRPDWRYSHSKVLAWTNKCVIGYNHFIRERAKGDPQFQPGDYAVCNSFVTVGRTSLKTDQLVQIHDIGPDVERRGVMGNNFIVDNHCAFFMPKTLAAKNERIKKAKAEEDQSCLYEIDQQWIDLRAAYACTINKAQGSTFDKVFIDLDDIRRCNSGEQIARMLYVAVSRAREHVYLTGDLA
jgi:energy-coupling factor transporter ATP-binding protein EcfA2